MAVRVWCEECQKDVWSGITGSGMVYHCLPLRVGNNGEWWGAAGGKDIHYSDPFDKPCNCGSPLPHKIKDHLM